MTAHTTATAATSTPFEFDDDFQTKIAALITRDTVFLQKTEGLIRPEYLTNEIEASLVAIVLDYYETYKKAPDLATLKLLIKDAVAAKKVRRDLVSGLSDAFKTIMKADVSDRDFVIDQTSAFARQRAVEEAMIDAVGSLGKRDFGKIETVMRKALDVGVSEDAGEYDYLDRLKDRTSKRTAIAAGTYKFDGITSGYPEIDRELYHRGWGRGELSVLMAPAKGGKSMGLGDFASNAALANYNVLYVTLEVSEEIIADRIDAKLSETMMKELSVKPIDVADKVRRVWSKAGVFKIRQFSAGSFSPSRLRRLIERYRSRGIVFDVVVVDYADIMAPDRWTDNAIENSKSIYVGLRGIAQEYNLALLTATQTNREGAKKTTSSATDVAEDFNKVRIADIIIGINATEAEKKAGECRLTWVAVRNGEDGFSIQIAQDRSRMRFISKVLGKI